MNDTDSVMCPGSPNAPRSGQSQEETGDGAAGREGTARREEGSGRRVADSSQ